MLGERFKRVVFMKSNVFTQMVVGIWKEIPEEAVEVATVTKCKINLDRYMH